MADRPNSPALRISDDPLETASQELYSAVSRVLAERGSVRLAIPGGSALAVLPRARRRLGDDWTRVALTWVDERCVPEDDAESNRGAARRLGLLEDPAPGRLLPLYEDGESPTRAAARVAIALSRDFRDGLDVLLLGMGAEGHIASLFPSRSQPQEGWVVHVADSPKPPADRITLTRAFLETARAAVLLVVGESKRDALLGLLAADSRLPACGLPGLVIVTDLEV